VGVALYVDEAIWHWQGLRWAHLLADDLDELHRFAAALGLHRLSYQGPPRTAVPHYDLTAFERRRAIALGARVASRHEMAAVVRRLRAPAADGAAAFTQVVPRAGTGIRPAPPGQGSGGLRVSRG
jgi:hypothetical protein